MTQPVITILQSERNLNAYFRQSAAVPSSHSSHRDLKSYRTYSPDMVGRNNSARASNSQRSSKSPAPAFLVEPSVPAACVSLLSLRSGDQSSARIPVASALEAKGNLPMLTTALTLLEGTGRTSKFTPNSTPQRTSADALSPSSAHNSSSRKRAVPRVSSSNESATNQARQKKSSGSRFWDTVLTTSKDSHHPRSRSSQPPTPIRPSSTSPVPIGSRVGVSSSRSISATPRPAPARTSSSPPQAGGRVSSAATSRQADDDESNKMNIPCVKCGVRFRKPGHLNMHWRSVHAASADAVYPGPVQTITAASRAERAPDARISKAKGVRPYGCPQCMSRFRRGSDRNRHMRMVHAKIRPFACTRCGSHFGRKRFLEAHISTVHEKQRPFRCECGAAFGQRSSLTRHSKKIHGPP